MRDTPVNPQHFAETQSDVFRLAKARHGLSVARLAALTGFPEATLRTWANGTTLPAFAMVELARHIPADLMNLLLEPAALCFAPIEESDSALADLSCATARFTSAYLEAVSDGKVTHMEEARLREEAGKVCAAAANVGARG